MTLTKVHFPVGSIYQNSIILPQICFWHDHYSILVVLICKEKYKLFHIYSFPVFIEQKITPATSKMIESKLQGYTTQIYTYTQTMAPAATILSQCTELRGSGGQFLGRKGKISASSSSILSMFPATYCSNRSLAVKIL